MDSETASTTDETDLRYRWESGEDNLDCKYLDILISTCLPSGWYYINTDLTYYQELFKTRWNGNSFRSEYLEAMELILK